jgi:hypothetical protein
MIANLDAGFDDCGGTSTIQMTSRNVGDLLTQAGVTWDWFYNTSSRIEATRTALPSAAQPTITTTLRSCITPPLQTHITCRRGPWV